MIGVNIDLHSMLLYLSCCNGEACFDHSKMDLLPSGNEHRAIRISYPKAFAVSNARQTFSCFSRLAVMGVNELINFYGRHFAIAPSLALSLPPPISVIGFCALWPGSLSLVNIVIPPSLSVTTQSAIFRNKLSPRRKKTSIQSACILLRCPSVCVSILDLHCTYRLFSRQKFAL